MYRATNWFQEQKESLVRVSLFLFAVALLCLASGCNRPFPESAVYKQFDAKAAVINALSLTKNSSVNALQVLDGSTEGGREEYLAKNWHALVELDKSQQLTFLANFTTACSNHIVTLGGSVTGDGASGSNGSESDFFSMRELDFETPTTVGNVRVECIPVMETKMRVIVHVFECRRIKLK